MLNKIDPIYPISPPMFNKEKLLRWAKTLLDCGAKIIQYREKHKSDKEFLEIALLLKKLCEEYKAKLIINDRVDIAIICDADGIHLGWEDLNPLDVRKILKKRMVLGISTHSYYQAKKAFLYDVDYIALGPVYPTTSKESKYRVVNERTQKNVIKNSPYPVVAIGGINLKNALSLYERGFSSLSAISLFKDNTLRNFKKLKEIYENFKSLSI